MDDSFFSPLTEMAKMMLLNIQITEFAEGVKSEEKKFD